jgi:DNA recombination protein RmuC
MGFRTLVIQKRASEVWSILGAVKSEFGKFGDLLDGVGKKLLEAQNKIEDATRKTRTIERRLQGVQELPADQSEPLLPALPMNAECDRSP